jgi:SAM-dependent methyltransferase
VLVVRRQRALGRDLDEAGTDGRKLMHSLPTDVYRCDACRSLFRHPAAVPVDVARSYRDDVYGEEELARLHRNECALATAREPWFRAHGLETDARILEVGSYAGGLLALARAHGCRAVGVDVGVEVGEFTRDRGFEVITGELERDMFEPCSFDAVFVLNCLEQLPDPAATLVEIRRVLRPRGSLVLRTPNAEIARYSHLARWRRSARASGVLGVPFARCFSPKALDDTLRSHGLEPVSFRGHDTLWMDVAARRS